MTPIRIAFITFFVCLAISTLVSGDDGALENAGEAVDNAASDVKEWGKGAVEDTGNWIKGAGETAGDAIEDIADRKKRQTGQNGKMGQPEEAVEKYEHNEDGDPVRKYIWGKLRR
uniref:Uncharacterized protein n=1 Tax=Plectus sambesii TaxID=2011161 RepID=A0A914WYJ8_9BILA